MNEKVSYYAIIPAEVRYDPDLPPNAKLLYGEITALCNETGYCWATNRYFAELYGVSVRSVQNWITALNEKKYIQIKMSKKTNIETEDSRLISIIAPHEKNFMPPRKKFHTPNEKNFIPPHEKNFTHNNTSKNITFNNMAHKKKETPKATPSFDLDEFFEAAVYRGQENFGTETEREDSG